MALTTRRSHRFSRAYTVDSEKLASIWRLIAQDRTDARVTFVCSDGSEHESNDVNDLLHYDNFDTRRVTRISFSSSYRSSPRINIEFTEDPSIHFNIVGSEPDVIILDEKLCRIIESVFSKHLTVRRLSGKIYLTVTSIIAMLIGTTGDIVGERIFSKDTGDLVTMTVVLVLAAGLSWGLISGFILSPLCTNFSRKLFPPASFCIGDGIRRFERSTSLPTLLFSVIAIGLLIAIVGAVVGAYLYDRINGR